MTWFIYKKSSFPEQMQTFPFNIIRAKQFWFYEIRPEVIKLFSCSTQLSMKFKLLINIEIAKIKGISGVNL